MSLYKVSLLKVQCRVLWLITLGCTILQASLKVFQVISPAGFAQQKVVTGLSVLHLVLSA